MKWNLRWAEARQDIWRPSELLVAFRRVGFEPSLSKVAGLWSSKPISVRLDDLDMICTALDCTVADLLEAEPVPVTQPHGERPAVGESAPDSGSRPTPRRRRSGQRRSLPPN